MTKTILEAIKKSGGVERHNKMTTNEIKEICVCVRERARKRESESGR